MGVSQNNILLVSVYPFFDARNKTEATLVIFQKRFGFFCFVRTLINYGFIDAIKAVVFRVSS